MGESLGCFMKKIQIEFVLDKRWRMTWLVATIFAIGIVGFFSYQGINYSQNTKLLLQQIADARISLQKKTSDLGMKKDIRYSSSQKAASLLQFDLNKVFLLIENATDPSTRLVNLSFDTTNGMLNLEYELNSTDVAVNMTERLNGGYDSRPCQLLNLRSNIKSEKTNPLELKNQFLGSWSCRISNI